MAEVQDPSQAAPEPSMEEILASIRKIISDDAPQPPAATNGAATDDVIELTQVVEEDGSVNEIAMSEPAPQQMPVAEPVAASAPPPVMPTPAPLPPADPLVSEPAATAAGSALSALANTVEIDRWSSIQTTSTALGNGSRTLEDMVIELMRPLLKQWLDQNLPATVDRLVQKEIERIARRGKE